MHYYILLLHKIKYSNNGVIFAKMCFWLEIFWNPFAANLRR